MLALRSLRNSDNVIFLVLVILKEVCAPYDNFSLLEGIVSLYGIMFLRGFAM